MKTFTTMYVDDLTTAEVIELLNSREALIEELGEALISYRKYIRKAPMSSHANADRAITAYSKHKEAM